MSQNDFNIANQTFPSFRSDLNDALQAAATMSAGASAPSTPYAYQLWFDTTTDTWKVRNSGNTAWISTITTDLATGNVLIGDSAPQVVSKLTVSGNGSADTGTFMYDGSAGTYFDINTNAANGTVDLEANARTGAFPPLTFKTGGSERARIDASGSVFVAKTATNFATAGIEIRPVGAIDITRSGGAPLHINRTSSDGEIVVFYKDGSQVGSIGTGNSNRPYIGGGDTGIMFDANNNAIYPWNTTTNGVPASDQVDLGYDATGLKFKNLYLGGGVYLGGTGSANHLDDYEEGSFNVVLGGSSGTSGQSYTNQTGRYTKIGSLVHCSGYITVSNIGAVAGTYAQIQNLPFTVGSAAPYGNGNYSGGVISYWASFNVNSAGFTLYPDTGATFAYVMYRGSFGPSAQYMSPSGWGSNPAIMFSLTYTTDA